MINYFSNQNSLLFLLKNSKMVIIDNVVVSDGFLNARFCCDLPRCKGWCCVEGDAGAPLEQDEVGQIEENLDAIKEYMRPEGIKVIEEDGVFDYDETGELVTPLINGAECAFVYFHENGTALCAIEKAYLEGKCDFWKPISCHLYPIRLVEKDGFTHILYHEWSVCVPAKRKGVKEGIPRANAYEMAAQSVLGSALMVLSSGTHPAALKDAVCSPGGTTIDAVEELERKGFRAAIMDAMQVCAEKSRSMSR